MRRSSARDRRQIKVAGAARRLTMPRRGSSGSTAVTATTTGGRISGPRPPVPQGLPASPGAVVSWVALLCGCYLAVLTNCPAVSAGPVPSGGGGYLDANLLVDTRIEAIGMCRVLCLKKFSLPPTNRSKPKTKRHLEECWNMCENLFRNPNVYLSLCNTTSGYCMDGCQVACTFQKLSRGSQAATNLTWTFGTEVQSKIDNSILTITWEPPTPSVPVSAPHPIVYTLLLRENDDAWRVLTQTSEHQYKTHSGQALWVPSFVLQAIDDTGIISSRSFDVKGFKYEKVYEVENIPAPPTLRQHEHLQAAVNVTYALSYDVKGGLEATLTWTHPASSNKSAISGEDLLDYELVYIMNECGIHQDRLPPEVPACHSPKDLFDASVPVMRREKAEYTIGELLFSSRYIVTLHQKLSKLETTLLARLMLETPFCQAPSLDYLFCDPPPQLLASPQPPPPSADGVSANVTQVNGGVSEEPLAMELDLIRDLRLELLPLPEAWSRQPREWGDNIVGEADEYWTEGEEVESAEERERLLVNVTWNYISDVNQVNFSLTLQLLEEGRTMTDVVEVSGATHVTAALLDNAVYEILIELIAPPETKGESGALFHSPGLDQTKNYIYHSRQVRVFNTSELRLAASERHQAVRMSTDKNLRAVNGAIIGVTCVGAVLAVTVLGLFLYKKRQSFKDIIVPKTTVAKSNSYKSSVGVKTDYSNQLMVFCDEWELDPQQLKFSTPLGQGAFGKVVTGYYMDHRVAIKLVKEGAPLSYKEDLVAEINLMKRLGAHPNIVCLVGACTASEPIALVMEYVPFGNLQNFLKKCRLEGDLQKREDGPSEIQYSMLQDCGGIENGVITPTDMLSFARQVAMAMEYLAEKKYVHRDLAARNVLLHFNKVVKVCDFGLSRDIFNDNQYKKLTNGKLPLKWMAIESLRDRIFTTHSDVWSFGILLWEIVTMGASPYPSIALADLYYVLSNHYRMGKPSNCSNELYGLMRSCWAENPLERPTFTEVRERLEELMAEDRDYLILEDIDVPLSASESSSNPTVPELFSGELLPSHAARQVVTASCSSTSSSSAHTDSASSVSAGLLRPRHLPVNVAAGLVGGSGEVSCAGVMGAAAGGGGSGGGGAGVSGSSSCGTSTATTSAGLALSSGRRPPMTIDVCVHQKSTERLVRPSESDSSP